MKPQECKPPPFTGRGGELSLSGASLVELLRAVLDKGKPFRFQASGFSMSPFVKNGDVITVSPLPVFPPRLGDIVACIKPTEGNLLVHRVVRRNSDSLLIQGDNAAKPDGMFPATDLLGRVTRIERGGKRVFFGFGLERYLLVWLVRKGWLPCLKSACWFPRRAAGSIFQRVQALTLYRMICRGLRKRFVVTAATAEDRAAVSRHLNPGSPAPPEEAGCSATDYVARVGRTVVGVVQLVRYTEADAPWSGAWLVALSVRPLYRRFGIGEALTRKIVEQARSERATELFVAVFEDNDHAIRLYRKLGFEFVALPLLEPHLEKEKPWYGRRRIVMRKAIRQPASA